MLKDNWQEIREEAMHLFDEGYIRAAEKDNDAGFGSFFKKGWKRFYLKWYDKPLPSAEALCPRTVELVSSIPQRQGRDVCPVARRQPPEPAPRSRLQAPCATTWACPRRTPMLAASTSMARNTPGVMAKT